MSPLSQKAMEPTKAAFGKAFWDREAESAAALDGHVRVHQSHAPVLARHALGSRALAAALHDAAVPQHPHAVYVKAEDGMVLDRVVANVGGRTWWHTSRYGSGRSARGLAVLQRGRPHRILGDPSLRAGRQVQGRVLQAHRAQGVRRARIAKGAPELAACDEQIQTRPIPTSQRPPGRRIHRHDRPRRDTARQGHLRSTAIPYHPHRRLVAPGALPNEDGYEQGASHFTLSLASRGWRQLQGRREAVARRAVPPFELAPEGGRRAPPRREFVAGASAEKQLTLWRGEVRPPAEGKRPGGYAALPVKPCVTIGGILGAICRVPMGNSEPGWKSGEGEWRQVCSGTAHVSFGSFQRPMFDYTSVDLRYDAGAIAPRRPLAERPAHELTVVERALESSGVRVESETVTLSATQQMLGPLRFRAEVRCRPRALVRATTGVELVQDAAESDGEGGEVYSGRFGGAWHSVKGR